MKWFKHDTDAHTDLKIQLLIRKYGIQAYGLYWICNELIGKENDENFEINDKKEWKFYIQHQTGIEEKELEKLLRALGECNLIDEKRLSKGILCNKKLQERADEYTKRVRRVYGHSTDNVPLEENRIDKNRREEMGKFKTPTPDQVKAYCLERNNGVDFDKWFNFYSAKGWMVGKNKMKDWKAAVRTWEEKKIASYTEKELPKVEEISEEQRLKNIEALKLLRLNHKVNKYEKQKC